MVQFLVDALGKANCATPTIQCVPCASPNVAAYDPTTGISICQNYIQSATQVEDALAHELIHAYDQCRVQFDQTNCRHHACSEIRAANLSGDCKWTRELFRGHYFPIAAHHQVCVKRRAILSLEANPACAGCNVEDIVNQVWKPCINEATPFLDIP